MRILLIAPESDLGTLAELIAAAGENQPTILHGWVGHREVLAALRRDVYDIIHFAGHGTTMRLELSDGPLAVEMFISAMEKRPQLIFLNSCRSLAAAAQMHRHGANYVIGWRDEVNDKIAGEFAVSFYNTLKLNNNPLATFGTARSILVEFYPEQELPVLLNGRMLTMEQEIEALRRKIEENKQIGINLFWRIAILLAGGIGLAALLVALVR